MCLRAPSSRSPRSRPELHKFRGTAKVFYDQDEAIAGLRDGLHPEAGNALFILYQGVKAGRYTLMPLPPPSRAATSKTTSPPSPTGRLSGAVSGACFGYASPEAALRGPRCAVRDGAPGPLRH
ncbi:MAG: dihydroxy-acid dehydratase [Dysosmobacter sp.]